MKHHLLLAHHHLDLRGAAAPKQAAPASQAMLGTVLANMAYFGYAPSLAALEILRSMTADELSAFWLAVEPAFRSLSGDDRQMDDVVVYKNFPREVLAMSQAQYWFAQVLMYLGAPNAWFTELPAQRPALNEKLALRILAPAGDDTLPSIQTALVAQKTRWTPDQQAHALWLARALPQPETDLAAFGFKENGVRLVADTLDLEGAVRMDDATDVLRLAAVLSGAEPSLRGEVALRSFSRAERRFMLGLLDNARHLLADMAMRPALWKKLMRRLHPGDFKFRHVIEAYHALYRGEYTTFNGEVEAKLQAGDESVLAQLQSRPGDFARRLHTLYARFGMPAVTAFAAVADRLRTQQLLKLRAYVVTANGRQSFIHPPRGRWALAKYVPNRKAMWRHEAVHALTAAIDAVLCVRLAEALPQGVALDEGVDDVKLQASDQELAPYGRGTVFRIPDEAKFLRTASFWRARRDSIDKYDDSEAVTRVNVWFDNGWCMFDADWQPLGACCWSETRTFKGAAVFSGDPTNAKDLEGRACQMIDLYLDRLAAQGVRYAVWNILAYSHIPFSDAEDVLATLQWGCNPHNGKLYEPSRAQMVFPLKGRSKVKYMAYVDVVQRRLVYLDADLAGAVSSASGNLHRLAVQMPAYIDHLRAQPSVADLFANALPGEVPVVYTDEGLQLEGRRPAYVFQPRNAANAFEPLRLESLL